MYNPNAGGANAYYILRSLLSLRNWVFISWRLRTWVLLTVNSGHRLHWKLTFLSDPVLTNARYYGDYTVMAGYYNDLMGPGYCLSAKRAERLYWSGNEPAEVTMLRKRVGKLKQMTGMSPERVQEAQIMFACAMNGHVIDYERTIRPIHI